MQGGEVWVVQGLAGSDAAAGVIGQQELQQVQALGVQAGDALQGAEASGHELGDSTA